MAQLKNAGLIDQTGNMIAAITYDSRADGFVNRSSVTLGGEGLDVRHDVTPFSWPFLLSRTNFRMTMLQKIEIGIVL